MPESLVIKKGNKIKTEVRILFLFHNKIGDFKYV